MEKGTSEPWTETETGVVFEPSYTDVKSWSQSGNRSFKSRWVMCVKKHGSHVEVGDLARYLLAQKVLSPRQADEWPSWMDNS